MENFGTIVYPATGNKMETPVCVFSIVFNPEGKIVYKQVDAVFNRYEGNAQGRAAVFGMLHTIGLKVSATPGDKVFSFIQRIGHIAGNMGRGNWAREEDILDWWVSRSRGVDNTEQW